MKTLKRHLTVTICSAAVLFLIILVMIQYVEKNKIMGDLGQLKQRNMELQKACDELQKQIEQYENSNAELEEELIKEKRTAAAGWQTFYGVWNVSLYGEDDSVTKAEAYCECVAMHHDRICVNGNWLYDEPLQPYGIQFYGSIFNELKMYRYTVPQMEEQMIIPPNVQMMLDTDKSYWVAYQYIDRYLEIRDSWMKFIILDEQTMICEYDGLWYLVEKSDVNMKEMVDYTV